jgi:hypothetical protein
MLSAGAVTGKDRLDEDEQRSLAFFCPLTVVRQRVRLAAARESSPADPERFAGRDLDSGYGVKSSALAVTLILGLTWLLLCV